MNKKFIDVKKIVVPVLTLIILIGQVVPTFAMSSTDIADIMSVSPTISVEMYDNTQVQSKVSLSESNITLADISDTKATVKEFSDVKPNTWYYNDVMKARQEGLVQGTSNNNYNPNGKITYAEYLTIISRILDETVESKQSTQNWYDKYITSAKTIGAVDKNEKVPATTAIPRELMIKYTCKALGIEPYTGNKVVFNDVKAEDAAYINAAYNEYLTDGAGRNASGYKVFGYGQTADRAQLAAMALRIKAYKENPTAFKAEKAEERKQADEAYAEKYLQWNGYVIPKEALEVPYRGTSKISWDSEPIDSVDFWGGVMFTEHSDGLDIMQKVLSSKYNPTIIKQAIDYAKTKVDYYKKHKDDPTNIDGTTSDKALVLEKTYKLTNNRILEVKSSYGAGSITFIVRKV